MSVNGVNGYNTQTTQEPGGFQKFMNPSDAAINSVFDGYKSYLNPLSPYSEDPEGNTWSTWGDPLMKTIDANIGDDETHFQKLNPIQTVFMNDTSTEEKARSVIDPGMACVTSFIGDDETADAVYTILNPVGGLIAKLFD